MKQTKFRHTVSAAAMNVGSDIAQLSYKELQALALRYRVPGNIKKKALVKVLQAARSGNETEFSRLLQELRKTRKRKTRKSKESKLGITSTPLHSPNYIMADEDLYYYQQQQQQEPQQHSSYQWIGAEEEIVSKEDDKIPHYEEFKQFLLKRIQREFQTCDTNNNQVQDLSMDLRTATTVSPNTQAISLNVPNYSKSSLINEMDPLALSTTDRANYQVKEAEGSSQGSFLLKRMLQAPMGANLGEIASSLFWTSNLLDNSDTLTAESENNENEDQLETAANTTNEYYGILKNSKGEFLLNEANLRNMEAMSQVPSQILSSEDQYRYPGDMDNRQNYQNWTDTNIMEMPESDLHSSKMFHAVYYNNTDPSVVAMNADNNPPYQYQVNNETFNGNQNLLNFDTGYTTSTDAIATNDSTNIYYLQNLSKSGGETVAGYFRNVEPLVQNHVQHNVYANDQQQVFSNNNVHDTSDTITYQYLYPRVTQETDNALHDRLENHQGNDVVAMERDVNQATTSATGPMEPFWPKRSVQTGNNLENILNYHVSKQVDYTKLSQTSCVYCYVAPIVSQKSSLVNNTCSQMLRYTAEQRQHSFSPYWMLYTDTSQGMRMTNMISSPSEQPATTITHTTIIHGNDELKDTVSDTEAPINDVWMNQYEQASSITDTDISVQVSDALFCNVDRIDDISVPDIVAKT